MGDLLLVIAMLTSAATVAAAATKRRTAMCWFATAIACALVAATVRLVWAIASLDFSFVYIANQARARSSNGYRLAALWAGAEGSLLYFASLASLVLLWLVWRSRIGPLGLSVAAATMGGLAITVFAFANPFERAVLPPVRGAGLTPILEHPAMLYHPTILYLGLVTTLIPFALVIDQPNALASDSPLVSRVRRALHVPWTLLTVGLATGANWAYVELGWGGYWAWDPVENTVLMPWLILTAAIHVARSERLCRRFPRSAVTLMAAPFPLVMFGTAVTRAGGLSSVHTFAEREALGWALGTLVVVLVGITVLRTYLEQSSTLRSSRPKPDVIMTRRDWLLGGSCIAAVAMTVIVLMGVGVPLLPGSNRIVTAPFYNRTGVPVLIASLLLMTLMSLHQRTANRARTTLLAASVVAGITTALLVGARDWLSLVVVSLGVSVVAGHAVAWRRIPLATIIGHVGFVVLAFGIVGSAQSTTETVVLAPGEAEEFGSNFTLTYESYLVTDGTRSNSEAVTARTVLTTHNQEGDAIVLEPGLVSYPDRSVILAETALHSTPTRDVQVVLRTITDDGLAAFELSERPALMLVWWGSILIALAGVVASLTAWRSSRR